MRSSHRDGRSRRHRVLGCWRRLWITVLIPMKVPSKIRRIGNFRATTKEPGSKLSYLHHQADADVFDGLEVGARVESRMTGDCPRTPICGVALAKRAVVGKLG